MSSRLVNDSPIAGKVRLDRVRPERKLSEDLWFCSYDDGELRERFAVLFWNSRGLNDDGKQGRWEWVRHFPHDAAQWWDSEGEAMRCFYATALGGAE